MNFQVVQQFEDPVGSTVISPIGVKGLSSSSSSLFDKNYISHYTL